MGCTSVKDTCEVVQTADVRLLVGVILSLLISSTVIALMTGAGAASLGDPIIYEPISGNFSKTAGIGYTPDNMGLGLWYVDDTTGALISDSVYENRVYFVSKLPVTGEFVNTYTINNSNGLEYSVILRETGLFSDSLQVRITDTGIYVESYVLLGYRPYQEFIPHPVSPGNHVIKTVFQEDDCTVSITVDDMSLGTISNLPADSVWSWGYVRYAGVNVHGKGLEVKYFESTAQKTSEESFDIWGFVGALAGVMGWYTDASGNYIVDIFINIIIKVQQIAIVAFIITLIRGN